MDASGKFRPTEADVAALGPEFKKAWDRDFKNMPDRPLMIIAMYLRYDVVDVPPYPLVNRHTYIKQLLRRSFYSTRQRRVRLHG